LINNRAIPVIEATIVNSGHQQSDDHGNEGYSEKNIAQNLDGFSLVIRASSFAAFIWPSHRLLSLSGLGECDWHIDLRLRQIETLGYFQILRRIFGRWLPPIIRNGACLDKLQTSGIF
jgi:hypothetical protein